MKRALAIAAVFAVAGSTFAVPQFAAAQSSRDYGNGDLCREQQRRSANKGTIAGGLLGAVVGGSVAGNGAKTEGALLGGALGAVAGHQIAKNQVKCGSYPRRVSQSNFSRNNCRWVQEYYGGRDHGFEVCRARDGVWRPSGRS